MYNPTKPYKKEILRLIERTWKSPYVDVMPGLYPVIRKKFSYPEVHHTDGIGTKGIYHWQRRTFRHAVMDALAMNLNDLAMVGAIPYAFQNHIVLPKDDPLAIIEIVTALAHEARRRKIAMTGGETSIHEGADGLDISITVSGFLPASRKNMCRTGDVLIGLKSGGLHANGMTKVRSIFSGAWRRECTEPTVIYADLIMPLLARYDIHGMMHITGGAFTKLKDILGPHDAYIEHSKQLMPQKIFQDIRKHGISNDEMYSTFNCGIGYVLSVAPKTAYKILRRLPNAGSIGMVTAGSGIVRIRSAFDGAHVEL